MQKKKKKLGALISTPARNIKTACYGPEKRQPTRRVKSLNKQQKDELKETERKLSGNKQKKTIWNEQKDWRKSWNEQKEWSVEGNRKSEELKQTKRKLTWNKQKERRIETNRKNEELRLKEKRRYNRDEELSKEQQKNIGK